ncbi:MAG: iron ABC transporter permease [Bacteroidales bacterium]|nr:iron ABC transporter permease [Bacteroidales bacterium]
MKLKLTISALILLTIGTSLLNLTCGSVHIPLHDFANLSDVQRIVVWESRLPAALCAVLCGAALGTSGLLLQSFFRNPLAGPSILGITSGAQLMVALVMLTGIGASATWLENLGTVGAAMAGALMILGLLLWVGKRLKHPVAMLIVGILLSYLTSAVLTLINYYASAEGVQSLLLWGMGTFGQVSWSEMPLFALLVLAGLILAIWLIRPLNGWMLGEIYAKSMGFDVGRTRLHVLLCTGLLCATTTAWCGPIAFIGLSMPHVARMLGRTDNHRTLLPLSALSGALSCSLCLWVSTLPEGGHILPLNALTPMVGIPVILYVILQHKQTI